MGPRRAMLRWHGGKWLLAPWIISHLPRHRTYVEPFGGGGSVLLRKPRTHSEVYNDLDGEVVNLFRVVRDRGEELRQAIALTPFARDEFEATYERSDDPVEQARRTVARSLMGFGSNAHNRERTTGFRSNSNRSGTTPARDWMNYPDALVGFIERLRGVIVENREATKVMSGHDGPRTLHYVDPPYVHSTRDSQDDYAYEMTDAEHEQLATFLQSLRGMVVLSGYRTALYDRLYSGWRRIDRSSFADGARRRVESLWLSPNCPNLGGLFE